MKKISIVTGTRAEYGLLKPVIEKVNHAGTMELQLVVTGMHLSPEFGLTYREIEQDGYPISAKIEMLLSSDTGVGVTKSMGVALLGFADYFERNRPDIVVILGDRYDGGDCGHDGENTNRPYPWRGDYGRGGGRGDQAFHNENEPPSFYGGGGVQKPGDPAGRAATERLSCGSARRGKCQVSFPP